MLENINEILQAYKLKGEEAIKKDLSDYSDFKEFEAEYCVLINEGNSICRMILQNPDCCDKSVYSILSAGMEFYEGLSGDFKCLSLVYFLINKLFKEYNVLLEQAVEKGDDMGAINLYEQMYNISNRYIYRKKIADLLYQKYKNFKQAIEIYQQIEPMVGEDVEYWNNYAELNAEYENNEKRDYCLKKKEISEYKLQIQQAFNEKDYKKVIKIYDELFKKTNDYSYKKEIANIYAVFFDDVSKAIKLYKELEPKLGNDSNYWFQFSELYGNKQNLYRQVLCIQKAIDAELKAPEVSV